MSQPLVLILSEASDCHQDLPQRLTQHGFKVVRSWRRPEALDVVHKTRPDLAIIDASRPDAGQDLEMVRLLRRHRPGAPVLLIVQESSEARVIAALRAGVTDYFKSPLSYPELLASIQRHLPLPGLKSAGAPPPAPEADPEPTFIGATPAMLNLKDYLARAAATDCNVLITGETGAGKEKVAELLHWRSPRRPHPLVCINCAALPDHLLEGELFGYERGAFTGAAAAYPGKLGLADRGTIFLDEIFEMSPHMQAKLLRAVDTRKIFRLGGKAPVPLNVRIVAATNRDVETAVAQGDIRPDLYYRLNVARVHLPPLRERPADIPLLLGHFLRKMNRRYDRRVESFCPEVMALLLGYAWPGNVRELRNLVEALFINLAPQSRGVALEHLPEPFQRLREFRSQPQEERAQVLGALLATRWNKSRAAEKLHISRMTLYRKMEKYDLAPPQAAPNRR